jgi:hypothetical protein
VARSFSSDPCCRASGGSSTARGEGPHQGEYGGACGPPHELQRKAGKIRAVSTITALEPCVVYALLGGYGKESGTNNCICIGGTAAT